jgi:hypothetical protein
MWKYRGAEVMAGNGACDAARSLANLALTASASIGASTIGVGLSDSIRERRPLDLLPAHQVDDAPTGRKF